ncbi:MAG: ADP-ribosylglycohydrolase family protein [Bacilli bacterium]
MNTPKYVVHALLGNAANLGIHWIYNAAYLSNLSKTEDLFFRKQDKKIYDEAHPSYYAYPEAEVGDVTSQGMFLFWLTEALKNNPNLSREAYGDLIYQHIKPGGDYTGYIETYGHKMIMNTLNQKMKLGMPTILMDDDHLIGFVPYIATKQLGLSNQRAWDLAQLFTNKEEYPACYEMFDAIMEGLKHQSMQQAVQNAIQKAPRRFAVQMKKAIEMTDTAAFVKDYAGTACAINQSVPIIIHLLYHSKDLMDAWLRNALISGAIAERAMLLTMILGIQHPISPSLISRLSKKFLSISLG